MKKTLSIILALSVIFALCIPAFAAVTTEDGEGSANLTYSVAQSFTVTIPESVSLNDNTSLTVSVSDSIIPFGESLRVSITGAANYDNVGSKFRLKDGTNDSYVEYTISKDSTPVALNDSFLVVAAGTATGSAILDFAAGSAIRAGAYADTLTFTVTVAA